MARSAMPYVSLLLALTAMNAAWAAPSLTTSAPIAAPSQAPASAPAASHVSLTVNTTTIMNRTPVQVKISGVNNPTQADAVALYFANGDPDVSRPLKWKWAVESSPNYTTTGSGTLNFNILNQRQDLAFYFFSNLSMTNGFGNKTYVGRSAQNLTLANPNMPLHGHLALTSIPTQMVVEWTTADPTTPVVMYGTSASSLTRTASATTKTYNASSMCGSPANSTGYIDPGMLHTATLSNLSYNTRYYYQYGDMKLGLSAVYSFLTGPPVGPTSTVHFLAMADLGHTTLDSADEYDYDESTDILNYAPEGTPERADDTIQMIIYDNEYQQGASRGTVDAMAADNTQNWTLTLLNGDVSYARGEETMWDVFMDQFEVLATKAPVMLVAGNHERDFPDTGDRYGTGIDSGGECGVPFEQRFQMPYNTSMPYLGDDGVSRNPLWYSFDHGSIHFLGYTTELDFSPGSPQYEFITSDLAAVNRSVTPWVIVNGHRPIYTTSTSSGSLASVIRVADDLREALETVLYTNQVDVTFHGHDHIYERTCPVYKKICQANNADGSAGGPVHVVVGNAGYELSWFANPSPPNYWDKIVVEHGYSRCTANQTTLTCTAISSVTGDEMDSWTQHKPMNWVATGPTNMTAKANQFNNIYNPMGNIGEIFGLPSANYTTVFTPVYEAFLKQNASVIDQLNRNSSMSHVLEKAVNGNFGTGTADTMVDVWGVLQPAYNVLMSVMGMNGVAAAANPIIVPMFQKIEAVAAAYNTSGGLWYESARSSSAGSMASPRTATAGR
uniref:Purple acid phosphatase n=1 Tax=Trebouxia lynnae TaxID=1825957 RepID=A0A7L9QEF6_9CHLO|nr:putative extracellular protein TR9_041a [Trebouxia lynnae]